MPAPVHLEGSAVTGRRLRVTSRTSASLPEQSEVSFGAYFNAFAAGYWRHWSALTEVRLKLRLEGSGRVDVYRTKADGARIHERGVVLGSRGVHEVDVALDLRPFEDGGWYWFDLTTDDDALTLHEGGWHAPVEAPGKAAVTIGMPTFNRPADCVATLTAIGEDPLVLAAVHQVILPDQGTRKVRDEPGFAAAEAALGGRLRIIDQPNLGGSGGYARVMYEALATPETQQILFMDDDILLEPDSVLRAVAFSRFAREPMLVGGQMLSLQARSQLSTMGEVVDRHKFLWRNAPQTEPHHDLAERTLRTTPWLHRRVDVDYNAWWMCLIPRVVAEDLGLPLPLFIKWDDAEYGLRARGAGLPDGDGAGHRDLAHVVPGEGRHQRLAGLLPLPQPAGGGGDARAGRPEGAAHRHPQAHRPAPDAHGVLGRGAAAHGAARLPGRPGGAVPEPAGGAGQGPGDPRGVRRRPPARLGDRGAAEQPGRARVPGLPGAAHQQGGDPQDAGPQRRAEPAARPTPRTTTCRSATCRRGRPSGSCCPRSTRRRSRPRTAVASPSAAATRSCSGPSSRPRRSCWARRPASGRRCAAATARRPRT